MPPSMAAAVRVEKLFSELIWFFAPYNCASNCKTLAAESMGELLNP